MSIYPTERDYLAEEENERRLEAKLERIEDQRIKEGSIFKNN